MRTIWTLAIALALTGCGYKKEIESLQAQLVAEQGRTQDAEQRYERAQTRIAELEQRAAELSTRIIALQADLKGLEGDLDAERGKSARILADRGALRAEIDSMKEAISDLERRKKQAEERVAAYKELVARFKSLIDAGTLAVRIVDGRMVVVLATDVLFDSGSADLKPAGKEALDQVAAVLATFPDRRFQIEGHTDDKPIATPRFPSNWYLASARAIGVVDLMVTDGMIAKNLSAASFADTRPVAPNADDAARAQNRRIEIVVVPDLSELPGYDELQAL